MSSVNRTQRFIRYLTDADVLDVRFDLRGNRITGFRVNYRAFIEGTWKEIVRYDTSHGRLHVHQFWAPRRGAKADLDARIRDDYTDAVSGCLDDLEANWQVYRRNVEKQGLRDN